MRDNVLRPVIGIAGTLDRPPADSPFFDIHRDITNEAYTSSIRLAGGTPILLPVPVHATDDTEVAEYLALCDGILLPGGYDIVPSFYGQERHELLGETDEETDRFQLALCKAARAKGLPVLGICKGCQVINVAFGGTLWQDQSLRPVEGVRLNHQHYTNPKEGFHQAFLEPGSKLATLFPGPHLFVNSLHHQQLKDVGEGLEVAARAEDGGIEAVEAVDGGPWTCGVQWHPEVMMLRNDMMFPIFAKLVSEARNAR